MDCPCNICKQSRCDHICDKYLDWYQEQDFSKEDDSDIFHDLGPGISTWEPPDEDEIV